MSLVEQPLTSAHYQVGYGTNKSTGRLAHIKSEDTCEVGMQLENRARTEF